MIFWPCDVGESLFELIDKYRGSLRPRPAAFHRVCTIMRLMGVKTAVIEELTPNVPEFKRFSAESAAVRKRLSTRCSEVRAYKLTFLRRSVKTLESLKAVHSEVIKGNADDFLGYIIVTHVKVHEDIWSYIFESVIREIGMWDSQGQWQSLPYSYLHVKRRFACEVAGMPYQIPGSFFRQQNSITNICAHSCAIMMLNNIPDAGGIVAAEDVNAFLDIDHFSRKFRIQPEKLRGIDDTWKEDLRGLETPDLKRFFAEHGYKAEGIDFKPGQSILRPFLYSYIESQYPAFLSFNAAPSGDQHVVAVVGHTLSPHSWLPQSFPYELGLPPLHLSTLAWVDSLIIHDDNFGMQFTLPAHAFKPAEHPERSENFKPEEALGIFPEKYNINLPGHEAVQIAASTLRDIVRQSGGEILLGNRYTERLIKKAENETWQLLPNFVCRPVLINWRKYFKQVWPKQMKGPDTDRYFKQIEESGLTHIWMVEITEPNLFVGNRAKIIDVFLNPAKSAQKEGAVLMVRLPQTMLVPRPKTNLWDELPGWEFPMHIPLFIHPLK